MTSLLGRWAGRATLLVVAVLMLTSVVAAAGLPGTVAQATASGVSLSAGGSPGSSGSGSAAAGSVAAPAFLGQAPVPSGAHYLSSGPGIFWDTSLINQPPLLNKSCAYLSSCINDSGSPAIAVNGAGVMVTAETAFTNASACPGFGSLTYTEVGVSISINGGVNWSAPSFLGDPGCQDAANYTSAMWPALTAISNDTFVLAYIEYNVSSSSTTCLYQEYYYYPALSPCIVSADRLVVTDSFDNGTSWTPPIVIDSVLNPHFNVTSPIPAQPALASYGSTVYLGWTNFSRPNFDPYSGPKGTSVGAWIANSSDGGLSFGNATALPVTPGNWEGYFTWVAYHPALAVNATGTLYVTYATGYNSDTNQVCQPTGCGYLYLPGEMKIVVARSTDGGGSFNVSTVATDVPVVWNGVYQWMYGGPGSLVSPAPAIAVDPASGDVYVAYTGGAFGKYCPTPGSCYASSGDYFQNLWVSNSTDAGVSWSTPVVLGDTLLGIYGGATNYETLFTPSIGVGTNGTVYVNAGMDNGSVKGPSYYSDLWTDYVFVSTNHGASFPNWYNLGSSLATTVFPEPLWDGISTSMAIYHGVPVAAWTLEECPASILNCRSPSSSDTSQVAVTTLFTGTGVTVSFNETGAPANSTWTVSLAGNVRQGPAGTNLTVSRVPTGVVLNWTIPPIASSLYGMRYQANVTPAGPSTISGNTTVSVSFEKYALLTVQTVPSAIPGYAFSCSATVTDDCSNQAVTPSTGGTWVRSGSGVSYGIVSSTLPTYCYYCMNLSFLSWSGSGNGSWNGATSNGTATVYGPVNETANFLINNLCQGSSCFNLTYTYNFTEIGLPANTTWAVSLTNLTNSSNLPYLTFSDVYGPLPFTVWTVSYNRTSAWVGTPDYQSPITATQGANVTIRYQLVPLDSVEFPVNFTAANVPTSASGWGLDLGSSSLGIPNTPTGETIDLTGGSPGTTLNATPVYGNAGVGGQVSSFEVTPFMVGASAYSMAAGGSLQLTGPADGVAEYSPLYWVDIPAPANGSVNVSSQWVASGQSVSMTATPSPGFSFVGWTGTGTGSKTSTSATIAVAPGGPITEVATFAPILPTYSLVVSTTGLPTGQVISFVVGATTYAGATPLTISGISPGSYFVSAPSVVPNGTFGEQYFATGLTSSLTLVGGLLNVSANGTVTVAFAAQYLLTIDPTVNGTVSPAPGSYWEMAGSTVTLSATPATGYLFSSWTGSGSGSSSASSASTSVTVNGAITERAVFTLYIPPPVPVYTLTLTPAGLPSNVAWSASIGSQAIAGVGPLTFTDLAGNVTVVLSTVSPLAGVRYVPSASTLSVDVTGNMTVNEPTFTTQYLVEVSGTSGGTVTPSSEWVDSGSAVSLTALPSAGYVFVNWSGSGTGSYSGVAANTSFTVSGPISEFADFQPAPPVAPSSSSGSILIPIVALVVLLVVGLVVGMVIARSGRGRAPPPAAAPSAAPTSPSGGSAPAPASSAPSTPAESGDEGGEVIYGGSPP